MGLQTQRLSGHITLSKPRSIAKDKNGTFDSSLDDHFLAKRSLISRKAASLLLSSSFGTNALVYAAFLGYVMGLWALIIQIAWMVSFLLLAPFANQVYAATSLHEFLGTQFGKTTRRVAAICSIIGITYFTGWEVAVARTSLESLATLSGGAETHLWKNLSLILLAVVIGTAVVYTTLWGRKASGSVNVLLNCIKIVCLVLVTILLFSSLATSHGISRSLLFPSMKGAILSLSVVGFITNILFNLSWQFVDNSSWQSISASRMNDTAGTGKTIQLAGISTLLTVNGIGTLLGTLLRNNSAVNSSNALGYVTQLSLHLHLLSLCAMVILIALSAMSLFDGAILSVSQAIVVDLGIKLGKTGRVSLAHARIATLAIGIVAAWGVSLIIQALGGSIFNFVYVVIIAQLSLAGPVLVGLLKHKHIRGIWRSIVLALSAGAGAIIYGTVRNNQNLLQAAGTITTIVSIAVCLWLYMRPDLSGPKESG